MNIINRRFGRLTVVALARRKRGHAYWNCKCTCGSTTTVRADHLVALLRHPQLCVVRGEESQAKKRAPSPRPGDD
jgi:hypothetical protein